MSARLRTTINGGPAVIGFLIIALSLDVSAADRALPVFGISKDTLYERQYFSTQSTDEVQLFNRGNTPLRIDSLTVQTNRTLFKTLSMDFGTETYTGGMWMREWVFYWCDGATRTWLSQPLVIPPRDSMRIYYLRLDRCARCDAKPMPDPGSRDMTATLKFHSNQGTASLAVRAWYKR